MKTCFKCNVSKSLDEFYPHPRMADGHLNKCKECTKKDTATRVGRLLNDPAWVLAERERHRLKAAKARGVISTAPRIRHSKGYCVRHPERRAAHIAVGNALRDGRLVKQPCEKCGVLKVQAHYDDYSKPLQVRWLCIPHHAEHHVAERERELRSQLIAA